MNKVDAGRISEYLIWSILPHILNFKPKLSVSYLRNDKIINDYGEFGRNWTRTNAKRRMGMSTKLKGVAIKQANAIRDLFGPHHR
jgi:hypothetical protein